MKKTYIILSAVLLFFGGLNLLTAEKKETSSQNQEKITHQSPKRAWLGIATTDISPALRAHLDIKQEGGLMVEFFAPGNVAKNYLNIYDILLSLDNQPLTSQKYFRQLLSNKQPGDKVTFTILRKGKILNQEITLGEYPMPELHSVAIDLPTKNPKIITQNIKEEFLNDLKLMIDQLSSPLTNLEPKANVQSQIKTYQNFSMKNIQRTNKFTAGLTLDSTNGWYFEVHQNSDNALVYECKSNEEIVPEVIPKEYQELYSILLQRTKNNKSSFNFRLIPQEEIEKIKKETTTPFSTQEKPTLPSKEPQIIEHEDGIEIQINPENNLQNFKFEIIKGANGEIKISQENQQELKSPEQNEPKNENVPPAKKVEER